MSSPDPVTTGVILAGALQVAKQGHDFIAAAAGRPGESIGTILGGFVRRRVKNAEMIAGKAHLILLDLGVEPTEVPFEILHPLLEAASVQEEPSIQDIWANLLANAADPRQTNPVSAVFPGILKELRGQEVRFLDALLEQIEKDSVHRMLMRGPLQFPQILGIYQEANHLADNDRGDLAFGLELMERHQLLTTNSVAQPINLADKIARLPAGRIPAQIEVATKEYYELTILARRFILACRCPAKNEETPA